MLPGQRSTFKSLRRNQNPQGSAVAPSKLSPRNCSSQKLPHFVFFVGSVKYTDGLLLFLSLSALSSRPWGAPRSQRQDQDHRRARGRAALGPLALPRRGYPGVQGELLGREGLQGRGFVTAAALVGERRGGGPATTACPTRVWRIAAREELRCPTMAQETDVVVINIHVYEDERNQKGKILALG